MIQKKHSEYGVGDTIFMQAVIKICVIQLACNQSNNLICKTAIAILATYYVQRN
jgi:hypothetical protein